MSIPRINGKNEVSTGGRACEESLAHTIEHRADEGSGVIGLLLEVQRVWYLWGVGVVGPRLVPGVRHGSGGYEEGYRRNKIERGEGGSKVKKRPRGSIGREWLGVIKSQAELVEWWRYN